MSLKIRKNLKLIFFRNTMVHQFDLFSEMKEKEIEIFEKIGKKVHEQFINHVLNHRKEKFKVLFVLYL